MANKKATPAASTPAQSYPDPYWPGTSTGPSWYQQGPMVQTGNGVDYTPQGGMANTPRPGWGYRADQRQVTPISANPAAMRGYMRYAGPEMQSALSSPDNIRSEITNLYDMVQNDPNDVVSQYRLRILSKALQDIYGVNQTPYSFPGPTTPGSR